MNQQCDELQVVVLTNNDQDNENDNNSDSNEDGEDAGNDEAQHCSTSRTRLRIPRSLIVGAEAVMNQ